MPQWHSCLSSRTAGEWISSPLHCHLMHDCSHVNGLLFSIWFKMKYLIAFALCTALAAATPAKFLYQSKAAGISDESLKSAWEEFKTTYGQSANPFLILFPAVLVPPVLFAPFYILSFLSRLSFHFHFSLALFTCTFHFHFLTFTVLYTQHPTYFSSLPTSRPAPVCSTLLSSLFFSTLQL